jgi:hypothetical protein
MVLVSKLKDSNRYTKIRNKANPYYASIGLAAMSTIGNSGVYNS